MYARAAGISKEVGEELVRRLEEFGWDANDNGSEISIHGHGRVEESAQGSTTSFGISMEVPIETILEVTYYTSGTPIQHESMGRNEELIDTKAPIESITLSLGTRSELSFYKDGAVAVKI